MAVFSALRIEEKLVENKLLFILNRCQKIASVNKSTQEPPAHPYSEMELCFMEKRERKYLKTLEEMCLRFVAFENLKRWLLFKI
jgi:hypothetical protein